MSEVWCRCPAHAPSAERILLDLIAELRDHPAGEYCCCGWCDRDRERADRAEARLKGLKGLKGLNGDGDE